MISCGRCGKEVRDADISSVIVCIAGDSYKSTMCRQCAELILEEMTPAMIPGYSVSRLDIILHQLKAAKEVNHAEKLEEKIKEMKEDGMTIPEIAQTFKISNRIVIEFLNAK